MLLTSRLLLVLLAVAASGCVYSRSASLASAQDRAEINARAVRGHAVVAVDGRRGRQVRDLRVAADTTSWTDKKTGEARSAPTASVSGITFRRDGAGALKGLAVGAGVGVLVGLKHRTLLAPRVSALLYGANGAMYGALIGAIRSERHVYRITPAAGGPVERGIEACPGPPLACAVSPPRRP